MDVDNTELGSTESSVESIPDDQLFEILQQLPTKDIYCEARLVCRWWYYMIRTHDFIYVLSSRRATYGLLYQDKYYNCVYFIYVREGEIERQKLMNCKFRRPIWTSCNGLVLEKEKQKNVYTIANLSTGVAFRLPPYPHDFYDPCIKGISYVAASMTYKVIATFGDGMGKRCGILSMGVDKSWRFISFDNLSPSAFCALSNTPLVNESFMHWQIYGTHIVTLNVETEIITETPLPIPRPFPEKRRITYCFCTGRYLSFLIMIGELEWEVWEMKSEMGEWRKLPNMCLEGQEGRMEGLGLMKGDRIEPCGWVKYQVVLALNIVSENGIFRFVCFYNLVKCEICLEKVTNSDYRYELPLHKYSLESPLSGGRLL